jgi:hypothetical protein
VLVIITGTVTVVAVVTIAKKLSQLAVDNSNNGKPNKKDYSTSPSSPSPSSSVKNEYN